MVVSQLLVGCLWICTLCAVLIHPLNFVAVILKVLLVNLLAALNFANVFLKIIKNVWKIKKR